jgi:hypothetical protein
LIFGVLTPLSAMFQNNLSAMSSQEQVAFRWDDNDVRFALEQQA